MTEREDKVKRGDTMTTYPEHEKLKSLNRDNQVVGEFLEWLQNQGVILARHHQHSEKCLCTNDYHEWDESDRAAAGPCQECCGQDTRQPLCRHYSGELLPIYGKSIQDWLAEYFEIDQGALEKEKRVMLEKMQAAHRKEKEA